MILLKKAIRSMLRNKKAYLSCIVLMATGIMMYVSMNTSMDVMEKSKEDYYESYRIADGFATVRSIPKSQLAEIESIEGIKKVNGRLVNEYDVYTEDENKDLVLKIISTEIGDEYRLNDYKASNSLESSDEILIGESFFQGNDYKIGDKISFVINNRLVDFNVSGTVLSPEYVFIMKSASDFITDTTKYNIGFIEEEIYMKIIGSQGAYNDLAFLLEEGYTYEDVESQLKFALEKYGLMYLYPKKDHLSYSMLETELKSNKSTASSIPVVFVSMASIMLYLMLKRIIEQDREQIGMMKAFGYNNSSILLHYIFYGFTTGFLGGFIGILISSGLIKPFVDYFVTYYSLPISTYLSTYSYYIYGLSMSIIGGMLGGFFGAKSILSLSPSEAMRAKAPKLIKNDIIKKLPFLKIFLSNGGIMAVRNIGRNKVRSLFIVMGIVFSFGMIAVIGVMSLTMDGMFYDQYNLVMKYDGEIVLKNNINYEEALTSIDRIEDITYGEGMLKIGVGIYNGYKETNTVLIGLKDGNYLQKIYDENSDTNLKLKENEIILTSNVANKINVKKGDYVYIKSPHLYEDVKLYISDIANQTIGFDAYINFDLLNSLIGEKDSVNSIVFKGNEVGKIKNVLLNADNVNAVINKKEAQKTNEELLQSFSGMIEFMQIMTIIIAFSIIYNTASISLSERSREYATLRIMGMEVKEVCEIMDFEYWILCVVGIIFGYPFTIFLNSLVQNMVELDSMAMPTIVPTQAYVMGMIGCIIAVLLSNLYSKRVIKKLDLVEVLKERE